MIVGDAETEPDFPTEAPRKLNPSRSINYIGARKLAEKLHAAPDHESFTEEQAAIVALYKRVLDAENRLRWFYGAVARLQIEMGTMKNCIGRMLEEL